MTFPIGIAGQYPSKHRLRALARHRPLRAAVRPPGADAEHPATRRSGPAVPPRVLRRADLLRQPRLPADRPVGALERDDRASPTAGSSSTTTATTSCTRCAPRATGPASSASSTCRATPTCSATTTSSTSTTTTSTRSRPPRSQLIAERPSDPFFLSIGFFETHREYFEPTSVRDSLYSLPPANLPDTAETRRDMASYKASARSLDHGVGAVLNALDEHDLADDTIVILTTDHGLAFPGAKATLTDRGLGVMLIVRGPGGFHGGKVSEALVSQIDIFPTMCELAGIERAGLAAGPLAAAARARARPTRSTTPSSPSSPSTPRTSPSAPSAPSATSTSGASASAARRCSRTSTTGRPRSSCCATAGAERELPREELHDLIFDPAEAANVADDPAYAEVRAELAERLDAGHALARQWNVGTDDNARHHRPHRRHPRCPQQVARRRRRRDRANGHDASLITAFHAP